MNRVQGIFVAVDGPKNVGKTSILKMVETLVAAKGLSVLFTKEPTAHFRLDHEQNYTGEKLAKLLTSDRSTHLEETVLPGVGMYDAVVTDRYIASSLVFQVLDGVPFKRVWSLNRSFRLPDLNIFLTADAGSLIRRRALRASHTRLEQLDPAEEINLYQRTDRFMVSQGVKTLVVDNSDRKNERQVARQIADAIAQEIRSDSV